MLYCTFAVDKFYKTIYYMPYKLLTGMMADTTQKLEPIIPKELSAEQISKINFGALLSDWVKLFIDFGIRVLIAVAIFYIGQLLSRLVLRLINKAMVKRNLDPAVRTFLSSLLKVVFVIILLIIAINVLGVAPVSFAALMAAAGVTLGASLSGQLQNFAGGIILLVTRPFHVGDYISFESVEGFVQRVAIFYTTLTTADNKVIHIPNGRLSSDIIINFSAMTMRRCQIIVGVDYDTPFEKVRSILQKLLEQDPRILRDQPINIEVHEMAASSVNILVRVWCKTEDYWDLFWWLNKEVYAVFNKEGISFAFPQLRIHKEKEKSPKVVENE